MIKSYLDQLAILATDAKIELKDACLGAGISDTTYYRWMNGKNSPRFKQANGVAKYIGAFLPEKPKRQSPNK